MFHTHTAHNSLVVQQSCRVGVVQMFVGGNMWILITENICSHNNSRLLEIKCAGGLKASLLALSPHRLQMDLYSKNFRIEFLSFRVTLYIGFDVFVHRCAFRREQVVHISATD